MNGSWGLIAVLTIAAAGAVFLCWLLLSFFLSFGSILNNVPGVN